MTDYRKITTKTTKRKLIETYMSNNNIFVNSVLTQIFEKIDIGLSTGSWKVRIIDEELEIIHIIEIIK